MSAKKIGELVNKSKNGVFYTLHKYNINTSNRVYDLRKNKVNDNFFSNIDTEEKAYILGFFMADGCIDDRDVFSITIHKQDKYILEKFIESMEAETEVKEYNGYVRYSIKSKQIRIDLEKLGITPRKTKVLCMPKIPNHLYKHLIRGYFDGDGSIWFDKGSNQYRIQFIGTKQVLEFISRELDINNKIIVANKDKTVFRLNASGNIRVSSILDRIYEDSTIYLERKQQKYISCKQLMECNKENKRQIWINNLGSFIRENEQKIQ